MDLKELRETHKYYSLFVNDWLFTQAAYDGTRALVRLNAIKRHERESWKNYEKRTAQAYGFGYSTSIVNLLNHYLFRKPAKITLPDSLVGNAQWKEFVKDCDLQENALGEFLIEQSRLASIQGHIGLLVDKATSAIETVGQEISAGIYPYLTTYRPPAILDWEFERDGSNRPFLSYLKLRDDDDYYRVWTRESWEIWEEVSEADPLPVIAAADSQNKRITSTNLQTAGIQVRLVASGVNALGEIPFIWLFNMPGSYPYIGVSDIADISYIDVSIIRNLSQGEEIIDYAAFPMMRKPMQEAGAGQEQQDDAGPAIVLEFNPEQPDSKPDWLPSEAQAPIDAILGWIANKVAEIYRAANIGGVSATENDTQAKSGVALKTEFQMLNSRLAAKSRNLQKAHRRILYYWLKWQRLDPLLKEVELEYPQDFDVENLAEDLANILTAKSIVVSDLFRRNLQKMVARRMLPSLSEEQMAEIDADIDASPTTDEAKMFGLEQGPPPDGEVDPEADPNIKNNDGNGPPTKKVKPPKAEK